MIFRVFFSMEYWPYELSNITEFTELFTENFKMKIIFLKIRWNFLWFIWLVIAFEKILGVKMTIVMVHI